MEVRTRHAARGAHLTDHLAALHRVADRDQSTTEMQVSGDEPCAVIDQHGGAAQV
jgi:hypothetical protein